VSEHIPKFRSIAQSLRGRITSGDLAAGTALIARRKLVKEYGTSRATIDKVVELLTAEGYLEPSDGNRPPIVADISHRTATVVNRVENHATNGRALGKDEKTKILSVEMVPCPADLAPFLGVEPGDEVLCRKRLNLVNGKPVATGYSYYPPEVVEATPELTRAESIPSGSRELAAERMGSKQKDVTTEVISRVATDEERELLELSGTYNVVTQLSRRVLLANGKIVEVAVKVVEGKRPVSFHSVL
jgi:GntR family transcriptional regulator